MCAAIQRRHITGPDFSNAARLARKTNGLLGSANVPNTAAHLSFVCKTSTRRVRDAWIAKSMKMVIVSGVRKTRFVHVSAGV